MHVPCRASATVLELCMERGIQIRPVAPLAHRNFILSGCSAAPSARVSAETFCSQGESRAKSYWHFSLSSALSVPRPAVRLSAAQSTSNCMSHARAPPCRSMGQSQLPRGKKVPLHSVCLTPALLLGCSVVQANDITDRRTHLVLPRRTTTPLMQR